MGENEDYISGDNYAGFWVRLCFWFLLYFSACGPHELLQIGWCALIGTWLLPVAMSSQGLSASAKPLLALVCSKKM